MNGDDKPDEHHVSPPVSEQSSTDSKSSSTWRTLWDKSSFLTPQRCRWNPEKPPVFTLSMNILFGFAGACTVANLYYSQPILNVIASDFDISYETSSRVPTLAQSGYSAGLFFLCPLGDLLRRRPFTLALIFFTSTVWIGLCTTSSFAVFQFLSFVTGFSTVTPQIMLPLVADLSPQHRRAQNLSIVTSGNLMGILIARILAGVVANYVHWRVIYWIALGLQSGIFVFLYLFMPDYPSTNPSGLPYARLLLDVPRLLFTHPVLMQSSLVGFCTSATFTSFWTTLTFLLASPPYDYSPLIIGLFALINIAGILLSPLYARTFIDRLVPLASALIGALANLLGVLLGTFLGLHSVAGPVLFAFFLDAGFQITQIANRSAIYSCEPKGRNRVNTAFMVVSFLGQVTGTAAGNKLYADHGWVASGSLSVGLIAFSVALLALRGPYEERWVGWRGGATWRKRDRMSADGRGVVGVEALQVGDGGGVEMRGNGDAVVDEAGDAGRKDGPEAKGEEKTV